MGELVFVYGTLRRSGANHGHFLSDAELVGEGSIAGSLYLAGALPAARDDGRRRVRGEVYRVEDLRPLDRLEGYRPGNPADSLYVRKRVPVTLDTGDVLHAWAYFFNGPWHGARLVPGGDYLGA